MIKKQLTFLLCLMLFSSPVFAGDWAEYGKAWGRAWKRGFTNVVTSPLEIPIAIQEYHGKPGRPVLRHSAGFVDGTFQMIERFGSGAMDIFVAILPGMQEGIPVEPETLF